MRRFWIWLVSWFRRKLESTTPRTGRRRVVARDYLGPEKPATPLVTDHALVACQVCGKAHAAATNVPLSLMRCHGCGARMDTGRAKPWVQR